LHSSVSGCWSSHAISSSISRSQVAWLTVDILSFSCRLCL
jgi:hypothetical protein